MATSMKRLRNLDVRIRCTILDIEIPFKITDKQFDEYLSHMECVEDMRDITPAGDLMSPKNTWLRIEVDNRHLENDVAIDHFKSIIYKISQK